MFYEDSLFAKKSWTILSPIVALLQSKQRPTTIHVNENAIIPHLAKERKKDKQVSLTQNLSNIILDPYRVVLEEELDTEVDMLDDELEEDTLTKK